MSLSDGSPLKRDSEGGREELMPQNFVYMKLTHIQVDRGDKPAGK
jgi:hypothetical protein